MMSANQKTHIMLGAIALTLTVIPSIVTTFAEELELVQARETFNELWQSATDTYRRRATLEHNLATFDTKVEEARQALEQASKERASVQTKILEQRRLIEALQDQVEGVVQARGFYASILSSQRETFVSFLRFVASKDIVSTDSGPVFGGSLMRRILTSSLGESIEDQLARMAILRAREQFVGRAETLIAEAVGAEERLRTVALNLDQELRDLERKDASLKAAADENRAFIDLSWKEKKLSEDELKAVALESEEANVRLADLQASLQEISLKLKMQKVEALALERTELLKQQASLDAEIAALERRDVAMRLVEIAATDARDAMYDRKNSDPKGYKKIEVRELQLKHAQELLLAETAGTASHDALLAEIGSLKNILVYLKQGLPEDAVIAFLSAKKAAESAGLERAQVRASLETLRIELDGVVLLLAEKDQEISDARVASLEGLPTLFSWPIRGPITAGYHDEDYKKVFGIAHRAIDIAAPQSSIVRSISDGIVFATRDGGDTGYSYVLIGHKDGFASLYGHVSAFLVKKGDMVLLGDAIALSGGLPGTHGAGHMTTGAHVHLEITKDGVHVDPRSVLPAR